MFAATVGQGAGMLDKTLKDRTEALTNLVSQGAVVLDKTLQERTNALATAIGQGADALNKTLADRTEAFTNLVSQGAVVLDKTLQERTNALATAIGQGADALNKTLADRTGQFNAVIDQKAALLDRALVERAAGFAVAVDQRASAMDKSLHDRTAQFIAAINQGAIVLDKTLAERSESFTNSLFQRVKALETAISQQTGSLDKTMTERAQAVIVALAERLKAIDMTFNQRAVETDRMLGEHARATAETFGKQTAQLNQVLANNSAIMQQTANQVGTQSKEAVSILTSQTQTLREVSRGLLDQIHGLTQRFENQGQAILTAAKALEFVQHQDRFDPGRPASGDHRAAAHGQHQGARARQHHALLCRHGGERDGQCGSPRQASRHGARPRHRGSGASRAAADRAPARRSPSPYATRGRRPQVELRDGHHPDRPAARADARPVRQHLARHARDGAEDGERSRQPASGDAEADGRVCPSIPLKRPRPSARPCRSNCARSRRSPRPLLSRPAAPPPAPAPDPFRQAAAQPRPQSFQPAPPGFPTSAPLPALRCPGRPVGSPDGDIGQVAGGLASQLSNAAYMPQQGYAGASLGAPAAPPAQGGGQLRLDEIARAIDYRTASDVWQRFRAGERGVLGRHIYTVEGQATFDEMARRYDREPDFRMTVDRYIGDFERLLGDAEASDPDGRMLQNYLTSRVGTRLSAARACERPAALDDFQS